MPVFKLPDEYIFPPPHLAEEGGLLAVGGDLSEARLLHAYAQGIFPWYSEGDPILWWSPDPRLVLFPDELKVSRSLRQVLRKGPFTVTVDRAFSRVIESCAEVHGKNEGATWITGEMMDAYINLHHSGYAHSVECWCGDMLAGGLYGVSVGSVFFGESMFARQSNASKVAFVELVRHLENWKFTVVDCQVTTRHLMSLGAREIPRREFLGLLDEALKHSTRKGTWTFMRGPGSS